MPAREWIPAFLDSFRTPSARRFAAAVGIPHPYAFGYLSAFLLWAAEFALNGDLSDMDAMDIACGVECVEEDKEVILAALVSSGYVDEWVDEDGVTRRTIHDWDEYADGLQRIEHKRRKNREYVRRHREKAREIEGNHRRGSSCKGDVRLTPPLQGLTHPLRKDLNKDIDKDIEKEQELKELLHFQSEMEPLSAPQPVDNSESTPGPPSDATADAEILIDASELSIESGRAKPLRALPDGFSEFWEAYPRRDGKKAAARAWARLPARDRELALGVARVMAQMAASGAAPERQYILQPATFINGERWNDWEEGPPPSWAPDPDLRRDRGVPDIEETIREMVEEGLIS